MITMTIKFTDFDGIERKEDFQFNLTEQEIARMNLEKKGGLKKYLENIIAAKDLPELTKLFEGLIQKSYGIKSPDGRKFVKSKEILDDFMATQAYSDLYMRLITNADEATKFINGIVPESMAKEIAKVGKPAVE